MLADRTDILSSGVLLVPRLSPWWGADRGPPLSLLWNISLMLEGFQGVPSVCSPWCREPSASPVEFLQDFLRSFLQEAPNALLYGRNLPWNSLYEPESGCIYHKTIDFQPTSNPFGSKSVRNLLISLILVDLARIGIGFCVATHWGSVTSERVVQRTVCWD